MDAVIPGFTHLCVHSYFSFLSSTAVLDDLIARAQEDHLESLALTDTNALYGAIAFARKCHQAHITPISGMSLSISLPLLDGFESLNAYPANLVLLAKNNQGYRSLCKISSLIQSDPAHETNVIQGLALDELHPYHQGLICLSGGRNGWIERALRANNPEAAYRYAARLAIIFGSDNVALSLEIHREEDEGIAREIHALAQKLAVRCTALNPIFCMKPEDQSLLRICTAIKLNRKLDEIPAEMIPGENNPQFSPHWQTPQEMKKHYRNFPAALAESLQIARLCQDALPGGEHFFPSVEIPHGKNAGEYLNHLAHEGMQDKYGEHPAPAIVERLERELQAIAHYGFSPLFLVVADIVRFAREEDIPTSSRGSVANSLVAYCAGITNVDPIEHDLLFERFLSPARADMPDIDIDFCSRRRDEILDYVRRKYGQDHVALVGTICTMRLRSAVRETAKVYGIDETSISRLVKDLPRHYHPAAKRQQSQPEQELLASTQDPRLREIVEQAVRLVGLPHHLGVHPGGVIITPMPLTDILPLQWATKGYLTTQYDHNYLETLGLPKLDLLGVSALTVLSDAARLVNRYEDRNFHLDAIPADDRETAAMISRGDTIGVFQCESQGARSTLRKLKIRNIRDLAIANAFFKPGPRLGGMAATFIRRYRGEEPVNYLHPDLQTMLGITKGVLIFQEQVLRVAREIAGLSWQQAGQLRKGMSKMKPESMLEIQDAFLQGCQRAVPQGPGMSEKQAHALWEQVSSFSGYGFNQGHATAYAAVSYKMAYLKRHFPAALMSARLANWGGFHHPAVYMVEALHLGFEIHAPHINFSLHDFHLTWEEKQAHLWMGLGQIRDLRNNSIEKIIEQRQNGLFTSLRDLLTRVSLQDKEITHLIQSGALDGLAENRNVLFSQKRNIDQAGNAQQLSLFPDETTPESGEEESLQQHILWEMKILGYPLSLLKTPLALLPQKQLPPLSSLAELCHNPGYPFEMAAMRIPGWTGGDGVYLWDGTDCMIAKLPQHRANPRSWNIIRGHARYMRDEWGSAWLQLTDFKEIPAW